MLKPHEHFFLQKVKDGVLVVGEDGSVYNNSTNRFVGATGSGRYPKYSMAENGRGSKTHHILIHRLVWMVYRGEIPDGHQINHIDGNRENRSLRNLEIVTAKENMHHAVVTGLLEGKKGEKNPHAKLSNKQVLVLRKRYHSGLIKAVKISHNFKISKSTVYLMLNGKTYSHVGGPTTKLSSRKDTISKMRQLTYDDANNMFGVSKPYYDKVNSLRPPHSNEENIV